jgi:hypothetical protein
VSKLQSFFGQKMVIPMYFEASNLFGDDSELPDDEVEIGFGFVLETYLLALMASSVGCSS